MTFKYKHISGSHVYHNYAGDSGRVHKEHQKKENIHPSKSKSNLNGAKMHTNIQYINK
jgi:hypothetical protein